ncbi:hypothetical protein [Streptomyces spectabilis]|uniref:Uncharacterized protein n=1 Tax=Streptomyces spectabilis TaxID=68270 RepID=A0A5P2X5D2_STRST|nr:hypothetical protein [Streptomyces spectabilis]MBB5106343.1 hypothetical protein [Streptomyces spectabilis]MCI3902954.1 hypothetical protein [Streptomyces spectabilis]QEV60223.1 hypothetical protein CP982_17040 [Streptomyces spectabilis]GGV33262.1 hypothetical protein GCM10010245_53700 [Streptomyces spectabilis]
MTHSFEDDPVLKMMRDFVTRYDSLAGEESKAAFLTDQHITFGVVQTYRKLLDIMDRRAAALPGTSAASSIRRRRRTRRALTAPPGRPGIRSRSPRKRPGGRRVTLVITLDIDLDTP